MANTFQQDLEFLRQHTETLVLGDPQHNAILLCPQYQGRVMTSTAGGASGTSFGWINYDLISSGQTVPQINLYGGEERFWLAPEGGRYSIFFLQLLSISRWILPIGVCRSVSTPSRSP